MYIKKWSFNFPNTVGSGNRAAIYSAAAPYSYSSATFTTVSHQVLFSSLSILPHAGSIK